MGLVVGLAVVVDDGAGSALEAKVANVLQAATHQRHMYCKFGTTFSFTLPLGIRHAV